MVFFYSYNCFVYHGILGNGQRCLEGHYQAVREGSDCNVVSDCGGIKSP